MNKKKYTVNITTSFYNFLESNLTNSHFYQLVYLQFISLEFVEKYQAAATVLVAKPLLKCTSQFIILKSI